MKAFVVLALLASVAPAAADETAPSPAPPPSALPTEPPPPNRSHKHQFGVDVTAGSGYRVVFRYPESTTCGGTVGATTCNDRLKTWLDLKIFFGFTDNFELVVENRFGLEKDFTATNQFMLMPGIRVYPSGKDPFKFFLQVQGVFDYTDPNGTSPTRYDWGVHEANGFQWDFLKWAGAYLQISETFMFVRNFSFQFEIGGGLEGRFP